MAGQIIRQLKLFMQKKEMFAMMCVCLNPCNTRIALCYLLGWMCRERKRRFCLRYICLPIIFMFVIFAGYLYHAVETSNCRDEDLKSMLKDLCVEYRKNKASGNLCAPLCKDEQIHYIKCLNYAEGKVIIFAQWKQQQIILKTKHQKISEREQLGFYSQDSDSDFVPEVAEFLKMLRSSIHASFGISYDKTDKTLLLTLWPFNDEFPMDALLTRGSPNSEGHTVQKTIMKDIWSLTQQDEYLFLQVFSSNQFLPKIPGVCGHVYAMEYAPSTGALEPTVLQWSNTKSFTWTERVGIAKKMLDLIKSTDADYHEPLHLCDIKGSNFGISNTGVVKPIDVDTVFFRSKLIQGFVDTASCTENKDCDFFDCKGNCDKDTQMCTKDVMNNNLQAICYKVFSGCPENMYTGLLHSPPWEHKRAIESALKDCRDMLGENLKYYESIFDNLKTVLQESVSSQR